MIEDAFHMVHQIKILCSSLVIARCQLQYINLIISYLSLGYNKSSGIAAR